MSARSVSSLPLMSEPSICLPSHPSTASSSLPLSQSYSRCDELRVRIHENHLSYLNREETPAKLEMRTKIECLIAEYLSLVPNTHKFSFAEVFECLNASIVDNKDFSAYKASNAFEALEKYATNLITLPWRTEYHYICPYSGFYRHVIDKHIVGANHILALMGFVENRSKGIYQLVPPIDPDRVSRVSLECLVAFVELQIMIQIRETLKSKGYSNISWKDIHTIRQEYICGQSDAIKLICEMKRTAKLIDFDNTANASNGTKRLVNNESRHLTNGYSLIDDNMCSPKQSIRDKSLDHNYVDDSYDHFEDNTESFDLMNYPIITPHSFPTSSSCHFCLPHSNSLQSTVCAACPPCPPPHMNYINPPPLFASFPVNSQSTSGSSKGHSISKGVQAELPLLSNDIDNSFNKISLSNKKSMDTVDGLTVKLKNSLSNKDNLQTIGDKSAKRGSYYDNLDPFMALEATVLSELKTNSNDRKQSESNKKSSTVESNQNSMEKKKLIDKSLTKIVNSVKPTASALKFANINERKPSSAGSGASVATGSQLATNAGPHAVVVANESNGKTRAEEAKCDNPRQLRDLRGLKGWSCTTCTYLNAESKDICDMCHRSRKMGAEVNPLVSGGRECSRCTLVNDKNEKYCRACDTSLADSPTYI